MNNHELEHRSNIERNAQNVEKSGREFSNRVAHATSRGLMVLHEVVGEGTEKYKQREVMAHEVRRNRLDWEDSKRQIMTGNEVRTDTPENYANDMEGYLMQTALGTHFVNLVKTRIYRGAPFMLQDGIEILDSSIDIWADNIIEKGDHNYLNALQQSIENNHPSSDDVLVNLVAQFMGGVNGDALIFFWSSMKAEDKHRMMKEVKARQKAKLENGS